MNLLKKILLAFIILSILTCLSIWLLTKNITHTAVKDLINKELGAITSQKGRIDGQVTWQLFPRPGVKIAQIHVIDEGNQSNSSLSIDNLLLNLQIAPLLHGRLVFKDIKIDGLAANINIFGAQASGMFGKIAHFSAAQNDNRAVQFAVERFLLTRGQIVIAQAKQKITMNDLQLEVENTNLKKKLFPLQFKTKLAVTTAQNKFKANLAYNGRIRLAPSILEQPLNALQSTGINGQLLARSIQFNQFKISRLSANTLTKKGTLTLHPLNMSLYSGESVGDLNYEFANKQLSINQTATKLNAGPFLKNFFGKTLVKGKLDISAHGSMNLKDDNWHKNIIGHGNLTIKDGVLTFINLQALADNASKKIHTLPTQAQNDVDTALEQPLLSPKAPPDGSTNFQLLNLQYQFLNSKFIANSLLLQTNDIQLKGDGQINLDSYALGGNLRATLMTGDSMVLKIQQLLGGSFPLTLTGTVMQPEILPNEREISPIVTKYMLKNVLVYPVKQIKNQLQNIILTPATLLLSN